MRRFALILLLLLPAIALAQSRTTITGPEPPIEEPPPQPVTRPPTLVVDDAGNPLPMLIDSVDVDVVIRGLLAETTMVMTFRNQHPRVLEGELMFPLPEGATVSGYGLDVGGELVEGVVVEKHQARIAFEKEVRRGVDPGLVEWVTGNNFRTRVYPIPANGTRTVMVRYVSQLIGDASQAAYLLPLAYEQKVGQFDLEVQVVRGTHKPQVTGGLANFEFEQWEDRWVASASAKNARLTDDLRVALPQLPDQLVSVEQDGDDVVFAIADLAVAPAGPRRVAKTPGKVLLLWDASASRLDAALQPELDLVAGLAARWGSVTIDVLPFRDRVDARTAFQIKKGDATELIAFLRALPYDGGTDLAAISAPLNQADRGPRYDLALLATDGHGNVGKVPASTGAAPLFTLSADSSANHTLLRHLATTSGGGHANLTATTPDAALELFGPAPFSFLGAEYDPAEIAAVHPGGRMPVHGRLQVTGRLLADEANIVLRYGYGDNEVARVPVTLRRDQATSTGLVPRFWAQQEVSSLAVLPDVDSNQMLALGRRYGIVTPGASLLVLETLEQHLEHDVQPPRSRTELFAAWQRHQQQHEAQITSDRATKVEEVVVMWQARVAWWETDFSDWQKNKGKITDGSAAGGSAYGAGAEPMESAEEERSMERAPPVASAPRSRRESADMSDDDLDSGAEAKKADGGDEGGGRTADITIQPWDPKTPYIANLKSAAERGRAYQVYLDQRAGYGSSPAYYIDCAGFFFNEGDAVLGRRVLTSILELGLDDPGLLRVVAYRLAETDDLDLSVQILEDVLELRPEEPQSYRDLALILARRGEAPTTADPVPDLERAMHLLHTVVMGRWDRFAEIEVIALMELNRLLDVAGDLPSRQHARLNPPPLDKRLRKLLDVDVRISLVWDADLTDIDLWVIEPTGEKAFYSNPRSAIGGLVSRDFTQGYGPEEYVLREAVAGTYTIQANYYGSSQQTLLGAATVKAVVWTDWGRPNQQRQELTLRLEQSGEVVTVGKIELSESP